MLMISGFATVLIGTCVCCMSSSSARISSAIEYTGGALVIVGLAMMGSQLRC